MARRDYSCSITMSDLLFNMLLAFVALFTLAFAQMQIKNMDNNAKMKAEYLITISWPKELDDDVDVYVEDPAGHLICFRRREDGLMHLDRDDLGKRNDRINTAFGVVEFEGNREIVTLRGSIPGEYIVNVHMFRRNSSDTPEGYAPSTEDCPVTVQLDQLNPYAIVAVKTVVLNNNGDEKTALRFVLEQDATGKYVVNPTIVDTFKQLVTSQSDNNYGGYPSATSEALQGNTSEEVPNADAPTLPE